MNKQLFSIKTLEIISGILIVVGIVLIIIGFVPTMRWGLLVGISSLLAGFMSVSNLYLAYECRDYTRELKRLNDSKSEK